jgi:hypothetical protein
MLLSKKLLDGSLMKREPSPCFGIIFVIEWRIEDLFPSPGVYAWVRGRQS